MKELAGKLFLIFFISGVSLYSATIKGQVIDKNTGNPLPGANLVIKEESMGAASDIDGNYQIRNVPEGNFTMEVSYIGYETESFEINIESEDQVLTKIIELEYGGSIQGEDIIVTAQASGELSSINKQISSNTITNIVDESKIRELPDANAAESIGRLPGVSIQRSGGEATKVSIRGLSPKYNTVTVNGVRIPATGAQDRSVDLSLISSNMLDGIEVMKAAMPDQDANSFGGTIDLKLEDAKSEGRFDLSLLGGYSSFQDTYGNYDLNVNFSNRFFNDDLGIVASIHAEKYDRSADKFDGNYEQTESDDPTKGRVIKVSSVGLREELVTRRRYGGSLVLDYKIPNGQIAANTFYNQKENEGTYNIREINANAGRQYWNTEIDENTTSILTNILSLNRDHDWFQYNATLAYTNSKFEAPENYRWRVSQEQGVMTAIPDENTHPDSLPGMVNLNTPKKLAYIWVDKINREEERISTKFNTTLPFDFGNGISGNVKAGVKFRWLDRYNDEEQRGRAGLQYGTSQGGDLTPDNHPLGEIDSLTTGYNLASLIDSLGYIPLSYVGNDFDRDDFLNGRYDLEWVFNRDIMYDLTHAAKKAKKVFDDPETDLNEAGAFRNNAIGSRGDDYNGEEFYKAGYIMSTLNIGNYLTLIPGIRWEGFESKYEGQRYREIISGWQDLEPAGLDTLIEERANQYFLPMVHLQYKPTDWLKIRLARTETISRPDYMHYAPITTIDGFRSTVNSANAQIEPSHAINYDLAVSIYQNKVGLFTIAPFYKEIEDNIIPVNFKLHDDIKEKLPEGLNIPDSWYESNPQVYTNMNNPYDAYYKGVELSWQTNFWYLPSFLKGLVFGANYTYIESSTKYRGYNLVDSDSIKNIIKRPGFEIIEYYKTLKDTLRSGRMLNQPTHVGNITVGYDYKGFSARLTYLFQTDVASYIHSSNPLFDEFTADYSRLDMQIKQKITPKFEIFGNYRNMTRTADRTYRANSTANPSYLEFYGSTIDIGIRYRM